MKIAFVLDVMYPFSKGGREKRLYELSHQFSAMGHDVHIFTMQLWEGGKILKDHGVTLHGIMKPRSLYNSEGKRSISHAFIFGIKSALALLHESFDILDVDHMPYFHVLPCKFVAMLKKKKMILTWHEVWGKNYWKEYLGAKGIFGFWLEKFSACVAYRILAVSECTKLRLHEWYGIPEEKIFVLPNGVEESYFQDSPEEKKFDLIFAGRFIAHKKADMFLQLVAYIKKSCPKIKAVMIGNGPEQKKLRALRASLELQGNLEMYDFLEGKAYRDLLHQSKIFVSFSSREGFGMSVLEALACGLPALVTADVDNASQFLIQDEKNGYVCIPTVEAFFEKAQLLLQNPALLTTMQKQSQLLAQKYMWKNITSKLEKFYKKTLSTPRPW